MLGWHLVIGIGEAVDHRAGRRQRGRRPPRPLLRRPPRARRPRARDPPGGGVVSRRALPRSSASWSPARSPAWSQLLRQQPPRRPRATSPRRPASSTPARTRRRRRPARRLRDQRRRRRPPQRRRRRAWPGCCCVLAIGGGLFWLLRRRPSDPDERGRRAEWAPGTGTSSTSTGTAASTGPRPTSSCSRCWASCSSSSPRPTTGTPPSRRTPCCSAPSWSPRGCRRPTSPGGWWSRCRSCCSPLLVPFVAHGPRTEVLGVSSSRCRASRPAAGLLVKGTLGVLASLTLAATTEPRRPAARPPAAADARPARADHRLHDPLPRRGHRRARPDDDRDALARLRPALAAALAGAGPRRSARSSSAPTSAASGCTSRCSSRGYTGSPARHPDAPAEDAA